MNKYTKEFEKLLKHCYEDVDLDQSRRMKEIKPQYDQNRGLGRRSRHFSFIWDTGFMSSFFIIIINIIHFLSFLEREIAVRQAGPVIFHFSVQAFSFLSLPFILVIFIYFANFASGRRQPGRRPGRRDPLFFIFLSGRFHFFNFLLFSFIVFNILSFLENH